MHQPETGDAGFCHQIGHDSDAARQAWPSFHVEVEVAALVPAWTRTPQQAGQVL